MEAEFPKDYHTPANIYLFKVTNRNSGKFKKYFQLTVKTSKRNR